MMENFLLWVAIAGLIYFFWKKNTREKKERADKVEQEIALESAYKTALLGNDRAAALALGRRYYGNRREGGALTIYDEQALTNDLSTMK